MRKITKQLNQILENGCEKNVCIISISFFYEIIFHILSDLLYCLVDNFHFNILQTD